MYRHSVISTYISSYAAANSSVYGGVISVVLSLTYACTFFVCCQSSDFIHFVFQQLLGIGYFFIGMLWVCGVFGLLVLVCLVYYANVGSCSYFMHAVE